MSVCHFSFPCATIRSGAMLEISLIINWGAASPYQIIDSLPTSASTQCQLLLHTKVNNKDYSSLPVLKKCGQLGTWIKTEGTHTIQYNTIPTRTPKLTCGRAVEDRFVKGEPSWLWSCSPGRLYFNFRNNHRWKQLNAWWHLLEWKGPMGLSSI